MMYSGKVARTGCWGFLFVFCIAAFPRTGRAQGRTSSEMAAQEAIRAGDKVYAQKRYDEAEKYYLRAVGYDASLVEPIEKLAAIYYDLGRHDRAVALLRRGLTANPGNAALTSWLGLHLLRQKKRKEGIKLLQNAVQQDEELFLAQLELGAHYMRRGEWFNAATAFWNFLKYRTEEAASQDFVIHRLLGVAYIQLKRYPAAQSRFQASLKLKPDYVPAKLGLAEVYVYRGYCPAALKIFQETRKLQAKRPVLIKLEATCLQKMNRNAAALQAINRYLKLRPKDVEAHIVRGDVYLSQRNHGAALKAFETAVALDPSSAVAAVRFGEALMRGKQYKRALRIFQNAKRKAARDPDVLAGLAGCFLRLKQPDEAIRELKSLLSFASDNVAGHRLLGHAYAMKRDYSASVESHKNAMKYSEGEDRGARRGLINGLNALAGESMDAGRTGEAWKLLMEAKELDPRHLVTNRNLGLVALIRKQHSDAIRYLRIALKRVPTNFTVNRLLGRAYLETKRYEEARRHYLQARQAATRLAGRLMAEVQMELGIVLARTGRENQAVNLFRDAVANSMGAKELNRMARENLVGSLLQRGHNLLSEDKGRAAVKDLELARANSKDMTGAKPQLVRFLLAMAYLDIEDWRAANEAFKRLGESGELEKVLQPPYDRLGIGFFEAYAAYRQGAYGTALTAMRNLEKKAKGDLRNRIREIIRSCYENQAAALVRAGKGSEAVGIFNTAARYGTSPEAQHNRALASYMAGNRGGALKTWRGGGMPAEALCNLGVHYDNDGQPKMAYDYYQKCLARGGGGKEIKGRIEVKRRLFGFE